MRHIITLLAILFFPFIVAAQSDVSLFPVSGTYTVKAQMGQTLTWQSFASSAWISSR